MACRTSAVMVLFCLKPAAALSTDMKRAELLRWLIDNHPAINLSAVNAHLQTPVHSALQSHSLEVLEVRSHWPASTVNQLETAQMVAGRCPLHGSTAHDQPSSACATLRHHRSTLSSLVPQCTYVSE